MLLAACADTPLHSPVFISVTAQGISVRGSWGKLLGFAERAAAVHHPLLKAQIPISDCLSVSVLACDTCVTLQQLLTGLGRSCSGLEEAEEGALPGQNLLGFKEMGKKKNSYQHLKKVEEVTKLWSSLRDAHWCCARSELRKDFGEEDKP